MIRKALFLSVAIIASAVVPVTSNAATAVNICVAYDLGGPGDRSYNDAVLAGLTKAKKTLNFSFVKLNMFLLISNIKVIL